jgi:hypothetical protein
MCLAFSLPVHIRLFSLFLSSRSLAKAGPATKAPQISATISVLIFMTPSPPSAEGAPGYCHIEGSWQSNVNVRAWAPDCRDQIGRSREDRPGRFVLAAYQISHRKIDTIASQFEAKRANHSPPALARRDRPRPLGGAFSLCGSAQGSDRIRVALLSTPAQI